MKTQVFEWPIRIGGVYHYHKHPEITAEVIAIGGGVVHYQCWYKGESHPYRADWSFVESFRRLYMPEDVSPIRDLVAALDAMLKLYAPLNIEEAAAFAMARTAVAKARAGAYCD